MLLMMLITLSSHEGLRRLTLIYLLLRIRRITDVRRLSALIGIGIVYLTTLLEAVG